MPSQSPKVLVMTKPVTDGCVDQVKLAIHYRKQMQLRPSKSPRHFAYYFQVFHVNKNEVLHCIYQGVGDRFVGIKLWLQKQD